MFKLPLNQDLKISFEDLKDHSRDEFLQNGGLLTHYVLQFDELYESSPFDEAWTLQLFVPFLEPCGIESLKEQIHAHGRVVRYFLASEIWVGTRSSSLKPSLQSDRSEHLIILAEERGGSRLGGHYDIHREGDQSSESRTLGIWRNYPAAALSNAFKDSFGKAGSLLSFEDPLMTTRKPSTAHAFQACKEVGHGS